MQLNRRNLVRATAMAPLAAVPALQTAKPAAAAEPPAAAGPAGQWWQIGAKPDYRLAVSAAKVKLFGHDIQGLLALPKEPNKRPPAVVVEDDGLFAACYPNAVLVPLTSDAALR